MSIGLVMNDHLLIVIIIFVTLLVFLVGIFGDAHLVWNLTSEPKKNFVCALFPLSLSFPLSSIEYVPILPALSTNDC